ncbi:MAG: MotA/TolQ/ExbB proton channel family protein [Armatimonadetes bacterium]|nr:MotA/TolQ/ExbB proton channel family protein [Armatimonadota bacterium]
MFQLLRDGGVSIWPLVLCSIAAVAVIIDRAVYFASARCNREALLDDVTAALRRGGLEEATTATGAYRGPVVRVVRHALMTVEHSTPAELHASLDRMKALQSALLEKRLYVLGTISATAPFIGLFGTVIGIQKAFQAIGLQNNAGIGVVGKGVSEALVATAVGLGLAIVSVIAYNVLNNAVDHFSLEMDLAGDEVCSLLEAPKRS